MTEEQKNICAKIWTDYRVKLYWRYLKNSPICNEDKEEILSEVFFQLCRKIKSDGTPKDIEAWLFSVARNLLTAKYREVNKHREVLTDLNEISEKSDTDTLLDLDDTVIASRLDDKFKVDLNETLSPEELSALEQYSKLIENIFNVDI